MADNTQQHGGRFYVVDGVRMREQEYLALKSSEKDSSSKRQSNPEKGTNQ